MKRKYTQIPGGAQVPAAHVALGGPAGAARLSTRAWGMIAGFRGFLWPGGQRVLQHGRSGQSWSQGVPRRPPLVLPCSRFATHVPVRHMPLFPSNPLLGTKTFVAYLRRGREGSRLHYISPSSTTGEKVESFNHCQQLHGWIHMALSHLLPCPECALWS